MRRYLPEQFNKEDQSLHKIGKLKQALTDGEILEAKVIKCTKDLELVVSFGYGLTGTIPFEEFEFSISGKPTRNSAVLSKVGRCVCFKVKGIVKDKKTGQLDIKLSRKAAQEECYNEYISKLQPGDIIDAKTTYIEDYGAFCDIGCGITALLPIDNVCVAHVPKLKTYMKYASKLKVVVKKIEGWRITLTHRELLGTFEEEVAHYSVGDTAEGVVRNVESYGVFIQLRPNLVCLAEPREGVKCDDVVSVYIRYINHDKMKVKANIVGINNDAKLDTHFEYHIPECGYLEKWKYSPDKSEKVVETEFNRSKPESVAE